MPQPLGAEDVQRLAELAGIRFPDEDLERLAQALAAHRAFVQQLLDADLTGVNPALTLDPRWRD